MVAAQRASAQREAAAKKQSLTTGVPKISRSEQKKANKNELLTVSVYLNTRVIAGVVILGVVTSTALFGIITFIIK